MYYVTRKLSFCQAKKEKYRKMKNSVDRKGKQ